MTTVKRLRFSTTIAAPAAKVWDTMFGAETYTRWTAAFTEGSYFEGDWSDGSRMKFLAPGGSGMIAEIAERREHEFLSIRHVGFVMNGVEDTESDAVRAWAPAYENYTFTAVPGGTRITVDQDLAAEHEESMQEIWARALGVLKRICEQEEPPGA